MGELLVAGSPLTCSCVCPGVSITMLWEVEANKNLVSRATEEEKGAGLLCTAVCGSENVTRFTVAQF